MDKKTKQKKNTEILLKVFCCVSQKRESHREKGLLIPHFISEACSRLTLIYVFYQFTLTLCLTSMTILMFYICILYVYRLL